MWKRILFCACICTLLSFLHSHTFAFELKGLQPIQPNGVFSSFKTDIMPIDTFAVGTDFERSIDTDYYRVTLKTGYGLTDAIELLGTLPYIFEWEDSRDGFEDASIGMKHRILIESTYRPSLAYFARLALPTGIDRFSTDGGIGGGLVLGKKLGPFSSSINVTYTEPFEGHLNEQIEIIAGFELRAAHNFDILAELYAVDDYVHESFQTVEGRFGYRIKTAENIFTLLGIGYDFKNRDPELRFLLSFNFLFDNSQRIKRAD